MQITEKYAEQISPSISLSIVGLDIACLCYEQHHHHLPTTLLVGQELLMDAYHLLSIYPTKFAVVPIPGMQAGWWALLGSKGMVWSFYE